MILALQLYLVIGFTLTSAVFLWMVWNLGTWDHKWLPSLLVFLLLWMFWPAFWLFVAGYVCFEMEWER